MTKTESNLLSLSEAAYQKRKKWENLWNDCYDYTFPNRAFVTKSNAHAGDNTVESGRVNIFDATAPDAVEQLAASILSELTPPWGNWVDLQPADNYQAANYQENGADMAAAVKLFHDHIQSSNFMLEIHQALLDMIITGTSVIAFEEADINSDSLFSFSAVPLQQIALEEGQGGKLNNIYRKSDYSFAEITAKFPTILKDIPDLHDIKGNKGEDAAEINERRYTVIEHISPSGDGRYHYQAIMHYSPLQGRSILLREGYYNHSPFIAFRWMKVPGEIYGRSPVMKCLPDIKTANKVVELTLKNASIAVTGIWQADDDGVLNPQNIKLTPGTIIPKAVGSAGLTPLQPAGDFDLSQLILSDLRNQIKRGLLADQLNPNLSPNMTATEVYDRAAKLVRILGATYGRLQSELLLPVAYRGFHILQRRGLIPPLPIDGVNIAVKIQSPLAKQQKLSQIQNSMQFLQNISLFGEAGMSLINMEKMVTWLAGQFDVPDQILMPNNGISTPLAPSIPKEMQETPPAY